MVVPEAQRRVLDEAWRRIPPSRDGSGEFVSFTRARIERVIALLIGPGSLLLGGQGFITAFDPGEMALNWHLWLVLLVFVPLAAMVVACIEGRFARLFSAGFATAYVLALLLWPAATAGSVPVTEDKPWIFYLINVATAAAVVAFPFGLQVGWTIGTPVLFGVVTMIQGGFDHSLWFSVALDVSFALILGSVLVTLGWTYRTVAANVDETRARAVASYAEAAAAAATEGERVAVAALMHDSVLGALLAAARANSPRERHLAVSMAREALTRLANAEKDPWEGSDNPLDAGRLAEEVEAAADQLGASVRVQRRLEPGTPRVPGRVARAIVLATMQAIANAVQHANAAGLAVELEGRAEPGGVTIRVRDAGPGFDLDGIPDDRLGIRGSILARVTAVGGRAEIDSSGTGTTVSIMWESGDRW